MEKAGEGPAMGLPLFPLALSLTAMLVPAPVPARWACAMTVLRPFLERLGDWPLGLMSAPKYCFNRLLEWRAELAAVGSGPGR